MKHHRYTSKHDQPQATPPAAPRIIAYSGPGEAALGGCGVGGLRDLTAMVPSSSICRKSALPILRMQFTSVGHFSSALSKSHATPRVSRVVAQQTPPKHIRFHFLPLSFIVHQKSNPHFLTLRTIGFVSLVSRKWEKWFTDSNTDRKFLTSVALPHARIVSPHATVNC